MTAYESDERVHAVVSAALASAGRVAAPATPDALLAFVKARVLPIVSTDLGPRIAIALVDELAQDLGVDTDVAEATFAGESASHERPSTHARRAATSPPVSGARATRPGVLFVDANRFQRSALARALIGEGCDVRVSESAPALAAEIGSGEPLHTVVVDMEHPQLEAILAALVESCPDVPVVALARAYGPATATLRAAGLGTFDVRLKDAPMDDVLDLVRRLLRR